MTRSVDSSKLFSVFRLFGACSEGSGTERLETGVEDGAGNQCSTDFSSSNSIRTNYSWLPQMVSPARTGQLPAIRFLFLCLIMETQILPIGLPIYSLSLDLIFAA